MENFLDRRRERVAAAWNLGEAIVLVGAGGAIPIPGGADQTYPYIAHSDYYYLTDHETPGGVMAFDPRSGWVDFVPDVTTAERVWEGKTETAGTPLSKLGAWLDARKPRKLAMLGCPLPGAVADEGCSADAALALLHARRPKDEVELERIRLAAAATAPGYAVARDMIRAGVTERQIQIEMETQFFRHGGTTTAYGTIVASGANSAVLHWPATSRVIEAGDVVLIDAGAAVGRYVSDVTRTYRAPGGDDALYRDLYRIVLDVEQRAIERCTAGREWQEIHLEAAIGIVTGLVALGLMKGNPQTLVETDAHALFFPHGLGHMVGLGVRDAGGRAPGRTQSKRAGLANLRVDLPLEVGYVMTVEPGLYFIPPLLDDRENREKYKSAVVWDRVDLLRGFGGIRIEDNVVITAAAPEVLTSAIPKALD